MSGRHPRGLFRLFFIEMWERLAFYTMVYVLLLYATDTERGGLGLSPAEGNEIYGLYLAFVYFTPFPGGMLADRYLGYRRAVLLGAVLMASGLFLLSIPGESYFIAGLCGLIVGNGFFKPNISVMVGNLYAPGDAKRDSGFNIFYMGINIGAFVASFLSAGVRNSLGWLWTFRIAGFGILIGMIILLISWKVLEKADRKPSRDDKSASLGEVFAKILLPALLTGTTGYFVAREYMPDAPVSPGVFGFLVGMVPVLIFFVFLGRTASKEEQPGLRALLPLYVAGGTFFMILHLNGSAMTQWARDYTDRTGPEMAVSRALEGMAGVFGANIRFSQEALPSYYLNAAEDTPRPDPRSLLVVEDDRTARMYGQQKLDDDAVQRIAAAKPEAELRKFPTEPGGGDPVAARAADVYASGTVSITEAGDGHGGTIITATVPDGAKPKERVAFVQSIDGREVALYVVDESTFAALYDGYEQRFGHAPATLPPGEFLTVVNPELYQSFNALFVIAFTPLIVGFFGRLSSRGTDVSTAHKLFYGLLLTTASLLVMAVAGLMSDGGATKVSGLWLVGFYAVVTCGELLLSPMGLSLVTKLTPQRLVGLAMGGWFMATAFGNNLSGFFGGIQSHLDPVTFFLVLAAMAAASALYIRLLLPRLKRTLEQYGA